jgi:hypothetical protein
MLRSIRLSQALPVLLALALLVPAVAGAKEESKIQIPLLGSGGGNGKGPRADVRTNLQGTKVDLQLKVVGVSPDTEYVLLCKENESATESAELVRFTTGSNGTANVTQNLAKTDDVTAPADPRGKFLVLAEAADPAVEVLSGWLYGDPADDPAKTKVKEQTSLAADETSPPPGGVHAGYRMLPNGNGSLSLKMRGVPAGDYEVWVDGLMVATLTPNSGGNATADFQTKPIKGKSGKAKPHKKKQDLNFDPRRKLVELKLSDGTPMFAGLMIAQIEGLNACTETSDATPLTGPSGSGTAALEVENDCETAFDVMVMDVLAGSYDLYVEGSLVGTFAVADEGAGTGSGGLRFDPTPDDVAEGLLDFPVGTGSLVRVFSAGANPAVDAPVLSGTLM